MKSLHRRPRSTRPGHRLLAFLVPALIAVAGTTVAVAGLAGRNAAPDSSLLARPSTVALGPHRDTRVGPDVETPARRWPAEIEHLLSSMPRIGDDPATPPMVETDQRCALVQDGLAHCVMLECQTVGEQTACFEMVVTARRLRDPPDSMRGGGDAEDGEPGDPADDGLDAPSLMDTHRQAGPRGPLGAIGI